MNIARRIWHRTFNAVMRALIPFFPYREPEILEGGPGVVEALKKNGVERALLVTGKRVRGLGLTDELQRIIGESGIALTVFDDTLPDPTSDNVEGARNAYIENGCQAIIAFGGGSVMDCAKAAGARIVRPKKELSKMAGLIKVRRKLPPFIAIPTTAGTGSETTVAAVIVDAKTHHKYVINDFCLIPHYALLDPKLTAGMPKSLTATTGMDALTHALEAYIGRARTKKTKAASEEAVKLIFENLEIAYEYGEDEVCRRNMLYASYLAGTAFTKSYVGYVHAVAHTLGGKYGVAHGLANAVLLPKVLRAYGDSVTKKLSHLARILGLTSHEESDRDAANIIIEKIESMNKKMQIPENFDCIKEEDIPHLASLADKEANPLYPVPLAWDKKELEKLYYLVYDKKNG